MRSEEEARRAIEQYSDLVRRLCMIHLKNYSDTEDIFQTVFLKYVLSSASFENPEHEKAWFIRVTINACKDLLKSFFRKHTVSLDQVLDQPAPLEDRHREVLEAVLSLPPHYKDVQGCGLSPLLRGLHRPGDRTHSGQKCQYHLYPAG